MSDPEQPNRHTIEADEATMEEMRRYAEAARAAAANGTGGHTIDADTIDADTIDADTIDADPGIVEEMRRHAETARRSVNSSSVTGEVTLPVPDEVVDAVVSSSDEPTQPRSVLAGDVPVPPDLPGDRWQPPPRTVLPTAPAAPEPSSAGPWKPVAIVLAVIVVVLAAILLFGSSSDDAPPVGSTVPGSPAVTSIPDTASGGTGDG